MDRPTSVATRLLRVHAAYPDLGACLASPTSASSDSTPWVRWAESVARVKHSMARQPIPSRLSSRRSEPGSRGEHAVGRTSDAAWNRSQDVSVDHRRAHIAVPKKLLDGADVVAILQQVCRKRVSQRVGTAALSDARLADGVLDGALQDRFVQVVATALARQPVAVDARRREHPLPRPLPAGIRIFPGEGGGELNPTCAEGEVVLMLSTGGFEVAGSIRSWRCPAAS